MAVTVSVAIVAREDGVLDGSGVALRAAACELSGVAVGVLVVTVSFGVKEGVGRRDSLGDGVVDTLTVGVSFGGGVGVLVGASIGVGETVEVTMGDSDVAGFTVRGSGSLIAARAGTASRVRSVTKTTMAPHRFKKDFWEKR